MCVAFKARGFAGFTPVIDFSEIYRLMFAEISKKLENRRNISQFAGILDDFA